MENQNKTAKNVANLSSKLPIEFKEQMQSLLGENFEAFLNAFSKQPNRGIVFNSNFLPIRKALETTGLDVAPLSFSSNCFKLESDERIGATVWHHGGLIYSQEPSSMVAGKVLTTALENVKNVKILDLCASPGGKTIDMALELDYSGVIVSNEIVASRAKVLFSNVERLGLKNVVITNNAPCEIARELPDFFDGVLVDAPCSGEGMFRKDPETIKEWNITLAKTNQKRQLEILREAVTCLKLGGYLVYSTCTYNTLENEEVINYATKKLGLEIISVDYDIKKVTEDGFIIDGNENLKKARRMFSGGKLGEGQFVCLLKKVQNCGEKCEKRQKNCKKDENKANKHVSKNMKIATDFLKETLVDYNGFSVEVDDNNIDLINYYVDKQILNANLNFVMRGIRVGSINNSRVIPHHHFFKALYKKFKVKAELSPSETLSYIEGNELACDYNCDGFIAVLRKGVPLGGGKAVRGRLKNFYPKGLRQTIPQKLV